MAIQFSTTLRNNRANQIESTIGTSPQLLIYTGSPPSSPSDSATGTLLVTITLPADWLTSASNGVVSKNGTWQGTASASGIAGYFRIVSSGTCHIQGTVGMSNADMIMDNTNIATGQTVIVNTFTITEGNA